jgi:dihydroorotate dehydrogenase electron transfer subunit
MTNTKLPKHDIPKTLPIKNIIDEAENIKTFIFEHNLNAKPGQFVNLWIPEVDEKPFSIAFSDEKEFWLTIAKVGPATEKLFEKKIGDYLGVRGPYGTSFTAKPKTKIALIGGGYGTAPLYFFGLEAKKIDCEVYFITGARHKSLLTYVNKAKNAGFNTLVATNDGSEGLQGFTTHVLENLLKETKIDSIHTCGPELMEKALLEIAEKNNIPIEISVERYMKCGFGICGQCVVDNLGIPLCKQGPVLSGEKVRKISEFGVYHRDKNGKKVYY